MQQAVHGRPVLAEVMQKEIIKTGESSCHALSVPSSQFPVLSSRFSVASCQFGIAREFAISVHAGTDCGHAPKARLPTQSTGSREPRTANLSHAAYERKRILYSG